MPELSEVETLRRDWRATLLGRRITAVFLHVPGIVQAIAPERKANTLDARERRALYESLRDVVRSGSAHRGASAKRGLYRDLCGEKGHHQDYLQVFRKQGQPCPGCTRTVEQIRVGGRATFVCPACQRRQAPKAAR